MDGDQRQVLTPETPYSAFGLSRSVLLATAGCGILVCLLLTARIGAVPALPAYLYFASVGILLAVVDGTTRKLPDRLTLPSYPVLAALLGGAGAGSGDLGATVRAAAASASLFLAFSLATMLFGMGLGDAKLAGLTGLVLGFQGWLAVYDGMLAAFACASAAIAVRVIRGQSGRRIAFGPFLVAGTLLVTFLQA